ncbi:MAG: N-acetylmuramoyl-L-alanine amidase, partial [Oscillospiraceae bacterium]
FILGSSDPSQPLTLDGQPVDHQTDDGAFGVLVKLAVGNNVFTLRQGSRTAQVRIRRVTGGASAGITDRISSAWPISSAIIRSGEALSFSCVAPSGSHVTAQIGGVTVPMTQKAAASASVPATFTGSLTLSGGAAGSVKNIGSVAYTLTHRQATTTVRSTGDVFLCGDGAEPWLRVVDHAASVFHDEAVEEGNYKAVYTAGVTERILGQKGEYYQLASTGYIKKAAVELLESDAPRAVTIDRITAEHTDRAEQFVLHGAEGLPYSFVDRDDGSIALTFTGRLTLPEQVEVTSTLFSSIRWLQNPDGSLTCELTPADPKAIWGVDVFPREGETILYAKRAPTLSPTVGRPLEGISIVLDPGHGGVDPGALGVFGTDGPTEKEINLAAATLLRQRLEQLGATVLLARTDNEDTRSLYERMEVAYRELPDFFLAMHHNSVPESVDGYQNSGVEAYYYAPFGKRLSEAIVEAVAADNFERTRRTAEWGYYTVTRMRYAPSVLVEIGFLPNPVEYRRICDTTELYKTANAIASAFLRVIKQAK